MCQRSESLISDRWLAAIEAAAKPPEEAPGEGNNKEVGHVVSQPHLRCFGGFDPFFSG